jgi:hypothetical protein
LGAPRAVGRRLRPGKIAPKTNRIAHQQKKRIERLHLNRACLNFPVLIASGFQTVIPFSAFSQNRIDT